MILRLATFGTGVGGLSAARCLTGCSCRVSVRFRRPIATRSGRPGANFRRSSVARSRLARGAGGRGCGSGGGRRRLRGGRCRRGIHAGLEILRRGRVARWGRWRRSLLRQNAGSDNQQAGGNPRAITARAALAGCGGSHLPLYLKTGYCLGCCRITHFSLPFSGAQRPKPAVGRPAGLPRASAQMPQAPHPKIRMPGPPQDASTAACPFVPATPQSIR